MRLVPTIRMFPAASNSHASGSVERSSALQPVHVGAGTLLPRLSIQQAERTADYVASLLVLAAVSLDDTEIFFSGAEADPHRVSVQQTLDNATWSRGSQGAGVAA